MALRKFILPPNQNGYSVKYGDSSNVVGLAGGSAKYRKDIDFPNDIVTCTWTLDRAEFAYFTSFMAAYSVDTFLLDLVLNDAELTEHQVHFLPSTYKLTGQKGLVYIVKCDVEAKPIIRADSYNEAIVFNFEHRGDNSAVIFDLFELLVNTQIPDAFAGGLP